MHTEKTINLALGVGKLGGGLLDDIFDMCTNGCKSQRNVSQGGNDTPEILSRPSLFLIGCALRCGKAGYGVLGRFAQDTRSHCRMSVECQWHASQGTNERTRTLVLFTRGLDRLFGIKFLSLCCQVSRLRGICDVDSVVCDQNFYIMMQVHLQVG